jgi:hypothetical protein
VGVGVAGAVGIGHGIYAVYNSSQRPSKPGRGGGKRPDYRPGQKPTDAPPGTLSINEHPDTQDIVHQIKPNLKPEGVGPASYVGIAPNGDVIVTNPNGTHLNLGHWMQWADW